MRLPALLRRRPSRLALRIYAIGLVQFVIVALAMEVDHRLRHITLPTEAQAAYVADTLARSVDDPAALQNEAERAARMLRWTIDIRDPDGRLLAHAGPSLPPGSDSGRPRSLPIRMRDGRRARFDLVPHSARVLPPGGPWVGVPGLLVFFVVGVGSWLIARSIARPLAKLAGAARAFGSGRLETRARLRRQSDEIGEVATAFDDMAERIATLLLTERELLANVSHELRTPLARIRVALDLATEADPHDAVQSFGEIAEDLAELERIVDDVLASARLALDGSTPTSTSLPVRAEKLDTHALLEKSIGRFRAAHPDRELDVCVASDLPPIMADAVLIRRVVDNLLDNAHKYTDEAAEHITLEARAEGSDVLIAIEDHGIGIARHDLERLFQPFFRADRSRTRATGGLGLGLALARRVVEAHQGSITVESELRRGTVARVRIPRVEG